MQHAPTERPRAGATLLELLVALTLTVLLLSVLLGLLAAQVQLARRTAQRVLAADAVRTAAAVLEGEAQRAEISDVRAFSRDSISLRSFRGTGIVCSADVTRLVVRYRGDRLPDERKDSVLVVRADGSASTALLLSHRAGGGCAAAAGEALLELRTAPHVRDAAVVLLYESGSYYLTARALRYRLGVEGRQPLTAEAFRDAATSFDATAGGGIRYSLTPAGQRTSRFTAAFGGVGTQ